MAAYAVLGATGNCGTALIELLLGYEDAQIHAYCRNKAKLIRKLPQVADDKRIKIFEGSIHDIDILTECIRNTKAIFHVVTTNENIPGCCVGEETAKSIMSAVEALSISQAVGAPKTAPKIVLLSSGTIDANLSDHMPRLLRLILLTAFSHVYDDLRRTENFLRSKSDVVKTIFIKPGGLTLDIKRGHHLNFDHDESFVSYLDLAAGMIEAANDKNGNYDMANVSVVNQNGSAAFPKGVPRGIILGLCRHFFPFLHDYLPLAL